MLSNADHSTGADPEFWNGGAKRMKEHSDRAEGEYD